MIYELLVFGTFWFWLFLLVEVIWLGCCAARECMAWQSILSIALFLTALQCFSNVNILLFLWHNPLAVILLLCLYLLGGCFWVFPKWWLFCKDHLRRYVDLKDKFLLEQKAEVLTDELKKAWQNYYTNNNAYNEDRIVFKPDPRLYKNRIVTWMALWPISFLWTMLNDPFVRFFRHVYYEIVGVLRKISDNVFKEVEKDL